jgi:hypothetical protein
MNQPVKPQQNIVTLDEAQHQNQSMVAVEQSRAVQTVQASLIIAKRFPRDEIAALKKIMNACMRPGLAEVATYSYPRGGANVTGPSIRLAEALAQYWGNIEFGWKEIDRKPGESTLQAYCWDKETNVQREQTFAVKHVRDTKGGGKVLTDEREIYENNANMAARRMRACILAMIPGDVIEDAVTQCEQTLKTKIDVTPERCAAMLKGFATYGVNKKMIEARIGRNFESITPAQFFSLGKIANSLKEGMSEPKDWFDFSLVEDDGKKKPAGAAKPTATPTAEDENKSQLENFKEKNKKSTEPHKPAQVSKPYTPAGAAKPTHNEDGEPIDNGEGDPEPE